MDISNQGPTDLTIRELSPMEVQLCSQGGTNEDSFSELKAVLSQDIHRTPISSQIVLMTDLGPVLLLARTHRSLLLRLVRGKVIELY